MSRGATRTANPAHLVPCSAGCGALVWLAGALPTTADADALCSTCSSAGQCRHCGDHLWLDGEDGPWLDSNGDDGCPVSGAGHETSGTPQPPDPPGSAAGTASPAAPTWRCQAGDGWTGDKAGAESHEHQYHEGAQTCWPIDEELDAYRAARVKAGAES
jgi:hypothetical protein